MTDIANIKYFENGNLKEENCIFFKNDFNSFKEIFFNDFKISNDLDEFISIYYEKNANEKIIVTNGDEFAKILSEIETDMPNFECHNNKEKILKEREEKKKKILEKKKKEEEKKKEIENLKQNNNLNSSQFDNYLKKIEINLINEINGKINNLEKTVLNNITSINEEINSIKKDFNNLNIENQSNK